MPGAVLRGHPPGEALLLGSGRSHPRSTFDPRQLGGCTLWLRADAGVTLNGSDVSVWADQSDSGNDFVQATASKQPAFKASGLNGHPSLTFDGITSLLENTVLKVSDMVGGGASRNLWTVFAVFDGWGVGASVTYPNLFGTSQAANRWAPGGAFSTGTGAVGAAFYSTVLSTITDYSFGPGLGAPSITVSRHTGAVHKLRWNGVDGASPDTTGAGIFDDSTGFGIGRAVPAGGYFSGDVPELICFNRALTDGQVIGVERYLAARYGVSL